jgi:hypothetical protein
MQVSSECVTANNGRRSVNVVAPVYAWFADGLDLPDLKDARILIDELNPGIGDAVDQQELAFKRHTAEPRHASPSSKTLACFKSSVSKPSLNQP